MKDMNQDWLKFGIRNTSIHVFSIFHRMPKLKVEKIIDANSFKLHLERSLLIHSRLGGVPTLSSLLGYEEFVRDNSKNNPEFIQGLTESSSDGKHQPKFTFNQKIRSGFLQILSFVLFEYISIKNLNLDGSWKRKACLNSSGPYKISEIEIGKVYKLVKNLYWKQNLNSTPDEVAITYNPDDIVEFDNTIVYSFIN